MYPPYATDPELAQLQVQAAAGFSPTTGLAGVNPASSIDLGGGGAAYAGSGLSPAQLGNVTPTVEADLAGPGAGALVGAGLKGAGAWLQAGTPANPIAVPQQTQLRMPMPMQMSDERAKRAIRPASREVRSLLDALDAPPPPARSIYEARR